MQFRDGPIDGVIWKPLKKFLDARGWLCELFRHDDTPAEFESHDLKREKVIPGNSEGTLILGPLKAGTYSFVGEFHEKTAKGSIIAK